MSNVIDARIAGISVPMNKKVFVSLSYIFGIGKKNVFDILLKANIDANIRVKDLTEEQLGAIRSVISSDYLIEGDLRSTISSNIKNKISIGCYQGHRHRLKLPVRGQRTKTNARTRKGRGVAIAGKKIAKK